MTVANATHPRAVRRIGVVTMYSGFLAYCTSSTLVRISPTAQLTLAVAGVLLFVAGAWAIGLWRFRARVFPFTIGMSDDRLDERQRWVKLRAYRVAYWILGVVALAVVAASVGFGWMTGMLLWPVLFLVAGTLPLSVVAWTEADPEQSPARP
jgi:MFS family permease